MTPTKNIVLTLPAHSSEKTKRPHESVEATLAKNEKASAHTALDANDSTFQQGTIQVRADPTAELALVNTSAQPDTNETVQP